MPPHMNTTVIERSILHYTNRERQRRGLKRLKGRGSLIRAARAHSRWMGRHNTYSHTGGGGSRPWQRAMRAGYPSRNVSENIWQSRGRSGSAWHSKFHWNSSWRLGHAAVISWMNSPGHRANLLTPRWRDLGVGVAVNRTGRIYLTQNFGVVDGHEDRGPASNTPVWVSIGITIVVLILALTTECW